MKKLVSIILSAMLLLTLTGCASKDYSKANDLFINENYEEALALYEKLGDYEDALSRVAQCKDELLFDELVGTWESDDIDYTDYFMYGASLGEDGDDFLKYLDVPKFALKLNMEIKEDGSAVCSYDMDALTETMDTLVANLEKAYYAYLEDELTAEASSSGVTLKDFFDFYGVSSVAELSDVIMGGHISEYFESLVNELLKELESNGEFTGSVKVVDGKLVTDGADSESLTYDASNKTISLNGENPDMAGVAPIFPIVLKKVTK